MVGNSDSKDVQNMREKGFFGHPKGLFTLFFTEFWERFSYYGMRAILLYYMYYEVSDGGLAINMETATSIMAIYGALIYMTGVVGGWISDRLLGSSKTIFYGGILIMCGHIALSIPVYGITTLFISIAFIVIGSGLMKPNIATVVGDLYDKNDYRRDSGFNVFYTGINFGALLAPIVVGTLGQSYNFHLGFGVAAVGMFIGLVTYLLTKRKYMGSAGTVVTNPLQANESKKVFTRVGIGALVILVLGTLVITTGKLTVDGFTLIISGLAIVIPLLYFVVMFRSPKTTKAERSNLTVYIPLFIAAVIFFGIQEQGSIILATFADKRTQLEFAGFNLQSSWFQSLGATFVVIFAPVFAWLWLKLRNHQPSTTKKFSVGLFFAGFSFLIMMLPAIIGGIDTLASPLWLVFSFFLVSIGELFLSPIGLSATTKLAPAAFSSQTMGLWYLANATGQGINAQIVRLFRPETEIQYFAAIGVLAVASGCILFLIAPKMQRMIKDVTKAS